MAIVARESIGQEEISIDSLDAPLFIAWQITSGCNLQCVHCCEESGDFLPDEMQGEEVRNFVSQIIDLKIPYVAISGGEPLLHPDFWEVCELLRMENISLKVETNGLFIDQVTAKKFADLEFRSVQVSVDGANPATHLKMRGGDWNKTIEACRYLVAERVNTEIVFVPTKFNYGEVGEVIDLAASLGVYGVYTGKIMRIGRAALNWEVLSPGEEEYQEFFEILEEKTAVYNGKMKIYYYPYDVIEELKYRLEYPSASLLVLPNGKVKIIGPLPFICGDLKRESLAEIWTNYKRSWRDERVIQFAKKVINNPELVRHANQWVELY